MSQELAQIGIFIDGMGINEENLRCHGMYHRILNGYNLYFSEELTLAKFLYYYPEFYIGYSALVTCIDSNTDVKDMFSKESLKRDNIEHQVVGSALFMSDLSLKNMLTKGNYFPHFCEIYFLKNKKPEFVPDEKFTSDGVFFDEDIPGSFFKTIQKIQADRYLSDGRGLNIASQTSLDIKKVEEIEAQQKH